MRQEKLILKINKDQQIKSSLTIEANQTFAGEYKIPLTFKESGKKTELPLNFNIQVLNDPKLTDFRNSINYVSRDRIFYLQKSDKFKHNMYNHNIVVSLSNPLIGKEHINEFSESGPLLTEVVSGKNILREEFVSKIYRGLVFVRISYFLNNETKVVWTVRNDGDTDYSEVDFSQGFMGYPYYQHSYNNGIFTHSESQYASLKAENLTEPWILLKKLFHTILIKFLSHYYI